MKKLNLTEKFLYKEYIINKKTMTTIAKEINCSYTGIYYNLIKYKINIRTNSEAKLLQEHKYKNILTKDFLYKEYITNKKSTSQISEIIECEKTTIIRHLKINNIKIRTVSEACILKDPKKHSNYKHGETLKFHYCKDCLKQGIKTEIGWQTAINGQGRCTACNWKCKNILPNKPEKLLNELLPNQYSFVGNGKLMIGKFCPDFVNRDNNKIIELFGCYWHKCQKCGFGKGRPVDAGRLKEYKKAGYQTLIIWEHELKNLDKVESKILEFNNGTSHKS